MLDNGEVTKIFDVVDTEFGKPIPIKHHKENVEFLPGKKIKYVKTLSQAEQSTLLAEIADDQLLKKVESKYELFDEMISLGRSLVLVGPMYSVNIQFCGNHPRLWVLGKNSHEIDIRCTDIKFCSFINSKLTELELSVDSIINSQNVAELKDKRIYFVIGLTGDSLDENKNIKDGKFAPDGMEPRYWPLVVSILTVPNYLQED